MLDGSLQKSRVGDEAGGNFQFEPEDFCWLIGMFFAAVVALNQKRTAHGQGFEGVRLRKRDLVSEHHVFVLVKLDVLAHHDPAVRRIVPSIQCRHMRPAVYSHSPVGPIR